MDRPDWSWHCACCESASVLTSLLLLSVFAHDPAATQPPLDIHGLSFTAGLGPGRTTNRFGSVSGWATNLGIGMNVGRTAARIDYFRVSGETEVVPTPVGHTFLGLTLERWLMSRFFWSAGAGFVTLSAQGGDRRLGGSLAVGGVPVWLQDHWALTTQVRLLAAAHGSRMHVTGAALLGIAWW